MEDRPPHTPIARLKKRGAATQGKFQDFKISATKSRNRAQTTPKRVRKEPNVDRKLIIEYESTGALAPYARNAKEHPDWQIDQITNSIEEFGFDDPIAVRRGEDGVDVIIEGHGRLLAAKLLGMEQVPVIRLDHLTEEQARAYALVHNQLTMNTGFDIDLLESEMAALDFDFEDLGFAEFTAPDADVGLESIDDVEEVAAPDPDEAEPRTKPGDVWLLGPHRVMCGDSTDRKAVARLMWGVER